MAVTPEAPLLWLETLLRHLGGTKSSLLVLDLRGAPAAPGRQPPCPTPHRCATEPGFPANASEAKGSPAGRQQGGRRPLSGAEGMRGQRPGRGPGGFASRQRQRMKASASHSSQLGPQCWANCTLCRLEFPHAMCVTVDPGLSGWKQPLQRSGVEGGSLGSVLKMT